MVIMMWEYYKDWSYGWGNPALLMAIHAILIIAGIVLIFFMMRMGISGNTGTKHESRTARQILDERYAKGEIDKETYEQMKIDIQ
ncbi:MAG: SHOCT domain-containing protein [Chlorobaculum sp.]|nr:SHOCT domain-containing protein [Chlorobaculum sp.]